MPRSTANPRLPLPGRNTLRVAILAALSAAPVLQAATIPPGGALDASEFLVNTVTSGAQFGPRIARDATGDFVVVWESLNSNSISTSSIIDIYVQRFDAAGRAQGSGFLANTVTGDNENPTVAMDAAGDFVVAWASLNHASSSSGYDIYARQYNAAGTALQANEFLVNTLTSHQQVSPSIAMDAAGDFVISWASGYFIATNAYYDVYARKYNATGTALQASEFLVNTFTGGNQKTPSVAMDAAGDFIVAWASLDQATSNSGYDVYAREFNSSGTALQTSEFLVNTVTGGDQKNPAVAMDAAGDFVLTWAGLNNGSGYESIYALRYNAAGTALNTQEFLVNTVTSNDLELPAVTMDAAGDFVVTWQTNLTPGGLRIVDTYARQYDAAGSAMQANEFLVNTFTTSFQGSPSIAIDAAGDFVLAWQSFDQAASGSYYDIYARRYEGLESVKLAATFATSAAEVNAGESFSLAVGVDNKTSPTTRYANASINSALGIASGITAVFTLPAGATAGKASGNNWSCGTPSNSSMTCSYTGSLAAATAAPGLTIDCTAPSTAGSLPFTVTVSSTEQDSQSTDNTATATIIVQAGSSGGGTSGGGGGGSFGLLSLAFLGLPLFRRRRRYER